MQLLRAKFNSYNSDFSLNSCRDQYMSETRVAITHILQWLCPLSNKLSHQNENYK